MISFLLKQLIFNGCWYLKNIFLPISYFLLIIHISINIYKIIKKWINDYQFSFELFKKDY